MYSKRTALGMPRHFRPNPESDAQRMRGGCTMHLTASMHHRAQVLNICVREIVNVVKQPSAQMPLRLL